MEEIPINQEKLEFLGDLWDEGFVRFPVKVLRWRLSSDPYIQELGDTIGRLYMDKYKSLIKKKEDNDDWEGFRPTPQMDKAGEAKEETFDDYVKRKKEEMFDAYVKRMNKK